MKVLVADKFEKSGIDGLTAAGCEVIFEPDLKDEALTEAIRSSGAEVLVVRSTKVTTPMLDAGRLSLIVRAGAGYNTIDVAGASKRGIYVSNCPGKNAIAVAELAFALMLSLDRRVPDNVADLRAGRRVARSHRRRQPSSRRTRAREIPATQARKSTTRHSTPISGTTTYTDPGSGLADSMTVEAPTLQADRVAMINTMKERIAGLKHWIGHRAAFFSPKRNARIRPVLARCSPRTPQ